MSLKKGHIKTTPPEKLVRYLAIFGIVIGLLGSLILYILIPDKAYRYIEAPVFLIIASVLYLLASQKLSQGANNFAANISNTAIRKLLNILFFLLPCFMFFSASSRFYARILIEKSNFPPHTTSSSISQFNSIRLLSLYASHFEPFVFKCLAI